MTEKRFHSEDNCIGYYTEIIDEQKKIDGTIPNPKKNLTIEELVELLNNLYKENQSLKSKLEFFYELEKPYFDEKGHLYKKGLCDDQLKRLKKKIQELDEEKNELKQVKQANEDARYILKKEFDFATEQRQKHLDDPVVTNAYDIIRHDLRRALDKLGGYE